jgi:hypothetical protein
MGRPVVLSNGQLFMWASMKMAWCMIFTIPMLAWKT